jgi:hypothetical protein
MVGRGRKTWARAALYAAALATPLAVSGCQSATSTTGAPAAGASSSAAGGASGGVNAPASSPSSSPASSASSAQALNATGGTGLTISDGGAKLLMNGTAVDFGTKVLDPAWSSDGSKVAFIDGGGNLVVANADGTGRIEAAHNPGGGKWSHPTWQTKQADPQDGIPASSNIFFASTAGGATLWEVSADAHDAQPKKLPINGMSGQGAVPPSQTGNSWPSGAGSHGGSVYQYDDSGSPDIFVRDDFLRQQGGLAIKDAAEPGYVALGSSGVKAGTSEVVFVRKVGAYDHVFIEAVDVPNATARDLTPHATTDCTEPAISPDGKTVAFSTSSGVVSVAADGTGNPAFVTHAPGFPAFRPAS